MTLSLFNAPAREPSTQVGFSGNPIDRRSEQRSDDSTARALEDPAARLMLIKAGKVYLKEARGDLDPWYRPFAAASLGADLDRAILLGWDEKGPVLAAPADLEPEELPDGVAAIDFRTLNVQGLLPEGDLGAVAQAGALLAWHGTHRFCGRCGHETEIRAGGYKRACPNCKADHFPRTDPVAIMLAVTQDRCLMGRSPHFPPGMYSCLAGFIEPGETVEDAVRRETFEEAGIRLGRVAYHASQPWPFPYSLMIGCFGEALSEEIVADKTELEDVRWFSRAEVAEILEGRSPEGIKTPPRAAIANLLIRTWVESR